MPTPEPCDADNAFARNRQSFENRSRRAGLAARTDRRRTDKRKLRRTAPGNADRSRSLAAKTGQRRDAGLPQRRRRHGPRPRAAAGCRSLRPRPGMAAAVDSKPPPPIAGEFRRRDFADKGRLVGSLGCRQRTGDYSRRRNEAGEICGIRCFGRNKRAGMTKQPNGCGNISNTYCSCRLLGSVPMLCAGTSTPRASAGGRRRRSA